MPASLKAQKTASVRERLLEAAGILFYNYGINATGIDMITAKAGVAKMSLYNNFSSKSDLVAAFIAMRHQEWLDLYEARLKQAHTVSDRIMAVFDAYQDHAEFDYENGFRGCGLLNAAAEMTAGDEGREAVRRHKEEVERLLVQHLESWRSAVDEVLPKEQVATTAEHLSFLLEGSFARAGLEGNSNRVLSARRLAESILAAL
ncbi:TetR/AcrR family transcriptional regulator [Bacillus subtilis]|uniref:TetR/AcrR family transcriptional regulator n=1 Tax=Pseudochrobactrum asaccharolyticum TaxID=354351 RepID=UPI001F32E806|nr:TetR/AcrR family transcriptional regulator [Pseudochrobactrum asaccharolyticum]MCF7645145.1 TetR/AcrR family transcriptional regulator [Pseudochrobactrum asaccharolyticum]MCF7671424.1 TetR/AcrR family transcriptional regulator [Bacillus subtilis]